MKSIGERGAGPRFKRDDLFVFRSAIVSYCSGHQDFAVSPPVSIRLSLSLSLLSAGWYACTLVLQRTSVQTILPCLVNIIAFVRFRPFTASWYNPRIGRESSPLSQPFRKILSLCCGARRVFDANEPIEGLFYKFRLGNGRRNVPLHCSEYNFIKPLSTLEE